MNPSSSIVHMNLGQYTKRTGNILLKYIFIDKLQGLLPRTSSSAESASLTRFKGLAGVQLNTVLLISQEYMPLLVELNIKISAHALSSGRSTSQTTISKLLNRCVTKGTKYDIFDPWLYSPSDCVSLKVTANNITVVKLFQQIYSTTCLKTQFGKQQLGTASLSRYCPQQLFPENLWNFTLVVSGLEVFCTNNSFKKWVFTNTSNLVCRNWVNN